MDFEEDPLKRSFRFDMPNMDIIIVEIVLFIGDEDFVDTAAHPYSQLELQIGWTSHWHSMKFDKFFSILEVSFIVQ